MLGMNATTGNALSGVAHLRQSVRDILTTPIGSRVMRREYGSNLPRLVDAPLNRSTIMDIYAATADALARWEPRIRLISANVAQSGEGRAVIDITGEYLPEGRTVRLDGIILN